MVAINYLWNPINDNIIREFDDAGTTVAEYSTEPDLYGNVVSQFRAGQTNCLHFDGQGNTTELTNDAGNVTDTIRYSAFGEVTERSGSVEIPFQYVGQKGYYRSQGTGEYLVRVRRYSPLLTRWLSVDPLFLLSPENATPYCYGTNNATNAIDPSGLCKVCGSGIRYRVKFADLDAHYVGTPYADLGEFARDRVKEIYAGYNKMEPPALDSSGPFTFKNADGSLTAGHYLVFVDWDICETDGECILRFEEVITRTFDGQPPKTVKQSAEPPLGDSWTKARRKRPFTICDKTLVYVDAPGTAAVTKQRGKLPPTGVTLEVDAKVEVIDKPTGAIVDSVSLQLKSRIDKNGKMSASP